MVWKSPPSCCEVLLPCCPAPLNLSMAMLSHAATCLLCCTRLCVNVSLCICIWLLTLKAGITACCKGEQLSYHCAFRHRLKGDRRQQTQAIQLCIGSRKRAAFVFGVGITHVSPWELVPLPPQQTQQTMQQQHHIRQLQQQQQQLSGAGLQTALLPAGGPSAMPLFQAHPHVPQYPHLQAGCVAALFVACVLGCP